MPGSEDMDRLIDIVGRDRANRSPEEIAEAENQLRAVYDEALRRTARRARTVGTVVAVIGFLAGAWPLILIPFFLLEISHFPMPPDAPFRGFFLIALLQVVCGFALGTAGLGFRRLKDWGRKTIRAVIWIVIAYCVGFLIFWEISAFSMMGAPPARLMIIPMAFFGLVFTAFYVFLLWLAQRYFGSARIRDLCSPQIPDTKGYGTQAT